MILKCVDCGAPKVYARDRCNRCYLRHRKELKKAGCFVSRIVFGRVLERLRSRMEPQPSGCIWYSGTVGPNGYGQISVRGVTTLAHRAIYELTVGPIPAGMDVDHVCHNRDMECPGGPTCRHRRCINVDHLEPVTAAENSRRGRGGARNAAKTQCPAGHPYDAANTHWYRGVRLCRACNRRHKQRAAEIVDMAQS